MTVTTELDVPIADKVVTDLHAASQHPDIARDQLISRVNRVHELLKTRKAELESQDETPPTQLPEVLYIGPANDSVDVVVHTESHTYMTKPGDRQAKPPVEPSDPRTLHWVTFTAYAKGDSERESDVRPDESLRRAQVVVGFSTFPESDVLDYERGVGITTYGRGTTSRMNSLDDSVVTMHGTPIGADNLPNPLEVTDAFTSFLTRARRPVSIPPRQRPTHTFVPDHVVAAEQRSANVLHK